MGTFHKVAKTPEVVPGSSRVVEAGGRILALVNHNGQFYALDNTCMHRGGPLGEGFMDGANLTCPWHGWQYDVTSGQCTTNPSARLTCFPTKVEGDDVFVEV
jgi:nitrite reductase/ring-hydroxylating ferredoxin subunit